MGSRLALGGSVMKEAEKIEAARLKLLELGHKKKTVAQNEQRRKESIAKLEAELLADKAALAAEEKFIQQSDEATKTLGESLKMANDVILGVVGSL